MFKTLLSTFVSGLMVATSASHCGFHNYAPQPTLVDQLLSSDEIVLARSAPDDPFRFEAFEALEGTLDHLEIPYLVDSTTRRRFATDANSAVLFSRDDSYGPWQRLAFVDAQMAPVLDGIMARLPAWEFGEDFERFSFFAALIGHEDNRIHRLAMRELDQADYSILRALPLEIEPSRLLVWLDDPNEAELKPIRVLLLGLSGEGFLRDRLEQGVKSSVSAEGRNLGAYATALIELVGPDAVTEIASSYLTNPNLSLFVRELLIEAIALHGQTKDAAMDSAIVGSIESVLWVDPNLAGAVARRFGSRSDWSHQAALQSVLNEGSLHAQADRQDVSQYLLFAREADQSH